MSPTEKEKRIAKRQRVRVKDYSAYCCESCADNKNWDVELRLKAECHFCKKFKEST